MKTVLYQLKTGNNPLVGMSYLIQASDGSIILIDGGMSIQEAEDILSLLQKLSPDEKPVVSAWFISHAHLDHTLACQRMAEHFSDRIVVKKMIYRFPDDEFINRTQSVVAKEISVFENALNNFEGVEILTPSTGDRYVFGETVFEVLFTCADLPPFGEGPIACMNSTSTVLRMHADGQTVLFLGDAAQAADEVMIRRHGKNLKSDICQVAHHGSFASTVEFYALVDPEILLWPNSAYDFPSGIFMCEADRFLVRDANVKEIIVAGYGTRRLEFPVTPAVAPIAPPCPQDPKEDTPRFSVRYCESAPAMEDPVWEKVKKYSLYPKNENYSPEVGGEASFVYTDDALYIKVCFRKNVLPSNPLRYSTSNSNNVRLYFSETPVRDYKLLWSDIEGEGCYSNIKFYPEEKQIGENMQTTTHPELCACEPRVFDGGYELLCKVSFVTKHKAKDRFSLNLEVTAVDRPEGSRSVTMYLTPYYEGYGQFYCPANMAIGILE